MITAEEIISGDRWALARLMTLLENHSPEGAEILEALYPRSGNAHLIGITGPSGSGKSTLVNRLALEMLRSRYTRQIGILAVDPTSPFSGGAILGDRVRMRDLSTRPEIFIRSMATRGTLGGLAEAANNAALALDAAGYNPIIIETVGSGQSEVEIAGLAHTTVVVEAPGLGDDVQAAKAGLMEIADILVVNKADKPAAEAAANALRAMLAISEELRVDQDVDIWHVPLLKTISLNGSGIPELAEAIHAHAIHLTQSGDWSRKEATRLLGQLEQRVRARLFESWRETIDPNAWEALKRQVATRQISPNEALRRLFEREATKRPG